MGKIVLSVTLSNPKKLEDVLKEAKPFLETISESIESIEKMGISIQYISENFRS